LISYTNYFKKQEKKETPRRQRSAAYKGTSITEIKMGKAKG